MAILREEMNRIGGQEFYLPALHPAEVWKESGRWDAIGDDMFRLKDRKNADMCWHDSRGSLHHHRAQRAAFIQTTAAGLVSDSDQVSRRAKAKVRLDAATHFHHEGRVYIRLDKAGLDKSFADQREAYKRIFSRAALSIQLSKRLRVRWAVLSRMNSLPKPMPAKT